MISLQELQDMQGARFASLDTDGDGAVSLDELTAQAAERASARAARMLEHLDENGDGLLQADEMQDRRGPNPERMLSHLDEDEDGMISEEEFEAMKERRGGRHGHGHKGRG